MIFIRKKYFLSYFFAVLAAASLFLPTRVFTAEKNNFPKRANYYLTWEIDISRASDLAKWDLLILDMELQIKSKETLKKIRQLNPNIKILAYITTEEIRQDAVSSYSQMRRKLASGISEKWYLTDTKGQRLVFWPETWMLNPADNCPRAGGLRWNEYLAKFAVNEILSTGLWDGIFYDNSWDSVNWLSTGIDLDKDGKVDADANERWRAGMKILFNETRASAGNNFIIVGNGAGEIYKDDLNGLMVENFSAGDWQASMEKYVSFENGKPLPRVLIINNNTANKGGKESYKEMRFGLASALLGNGYYSFDYGDKDHGQVWWYDEYEINLGKAVSEARSLSGKTDFQRDVWRRDFTNGIVLVNSSDKSAEVDLGGEYEKIIGSQDAEANDGSIVSKIKLNAKEGLLLLKTFQTARDTVFINGGFASFFDIKGRRARNGFFIYEEGFSGGVKIYSGDLNGDGREEKIIIKGGKVEIYNSVGGRWFSDYPFSGNMAGDIGLAVNTETKQKTDEIFLASPTGGKIIKYDYSGAILNEGFYPVGKKYVGAVKIASGDIDGDGTAEFIAGKESTGEIFIYDNSLARLKIKFTIDMKKAKSGNKNFALASGDVNKDGKDEIIAGFNSGKNFLIMVYNQKGKKISEFGAPLLFGANKIYLEAVDVNFDGADEIVMIRE
ncbi:MAG: putative glycoside hydrolase [Patescibacteria group bacterium]|nr:putative glycoside hydrolase [Patescibacteria group bacterium]